MRSRIIFNKMEMPITISEIESTLRASLPIQTVSQLEDFPYASYSEFIDAHRSGNVHLLTRYDAETSRVLGTNKQKSIYFSIVNAPIIVAVAMLVLSFALWNFWLLFGIPLAFIGLSFSSPFVMKTFGKAILILVGICFVISLVNGYQAATFLTGAYAVSNYLTHAAREYSQDIALNAVTQSELVLIWLVLKKVVIVRPRT